MKISAKVSNSLNHHEVWLDTNGTVSQLNIPSRPTGFGSSANGGELLFLSLATCFCNDLYREAAKKDITLSKVEVEASGEFTAEGEPGFNLTYEVAIEGDAPKSVLDTLIAHTDKVAEIHNTLRKGVSVTLTSK
ncbi:OsmC family protein [Flagellimonas algicola]|uniref:OsmC family protein n=1 Tax=Flagellimonas algicola TaxID=2583815 RepID=A0ABY2WQ68_9FLAO|nr:OsmC family protein [Allomuricauda algicola]TMU57135.1 OsmC family protein [Allomuricauda algicola]